MEQGFHTVTLLAAEWSDYERAVARADRDAMRELLQRFAEVFDAATAHGGAMLQKHGARRLVGFDSATGALKAALELRERAMKAGFPLKFAVTQGDVDVTETSVWGGASELAFSVLEHIEPNTIVFGPTVRNSMDEASVAHHPFRKLTTVLPRPRLFHRLVASDQCFVPDDVMDAARNRRLVLVHAGNPTQPLAPEQHALLIGFEPESTELEAVVESLGAAPERIAWLVQRVGEAGRHAWVSRGFKLVIGTREQLAFTLPSGDDDSLTPPTDPPPARKRKAPAKTVISGEHRANTNPSGKHRARRPSAVETIISTEFDVDEILPPTKPAGGPVLRIVGLALPAMPLGDVLQECTFTLGTSGKRWVTKRSGGLLEIAVQPLRVKLTSLDAQISVDGRSLPGRDSTTLKDGNVVKAGKREHEFVKLDGPYAGMMLSDTRHHIAVGDGVSVGRQPEFPGLPVPDRKGQHGLVFLETPRAMAARERGFALDRALIGQQHCKVINTPSPAVEHLHPRCHTYLWRNRTLFAVSKAARLELGDHILVGTAVLRLDPC